MRDETAREPDPLGDFLEETVRGLGHGLRGAWRYRLELLLGAMVAVSALLMAPEPTIVQLTAAVGIAALIGAAWPILGPELARARARRAWQDATDGVYRIRRIRIIPVGERITVQIPRGDTVDTLERLAPQLRDTMRVDDVTVARSGRGRADVTVYRRVPFDAAPVAWPWQNRDQTSVWEPMPFAVDEAGQPIALDTMGGHVLIAGATNSGKTVGLGQFVSTIALDPRAVPIFLDAKLVGLGPWASVAARFVGNDIREAIAVLETMCRVIDERLPAMLAAGKDHVDPGTTTYQIVIDELASYSAHPDPKLRRRFTTALLDILQRGRAPGVRIVAAMQRPAADLLNSNVRAQFTWRISFRVEEEETTRMMFTGKDAAPHEIPPGDAWRGVCYTQTEGDSRVQQAKAYMIDAAARRDIITRAEALRADLPADPLATLDPEPAREPEPTAPASPAGAGDSRTRSVWEALPDDAAQAVSYTDLERMLGGRHRWRGDLQRLCDSGAVQVRRGNSHGGPKLFWRTRDSEVAEPSP